MVGKSVKKDMLTYMTGIDVKTAFHKLHEILDIRAFAEESEDIVKTMETEIKNLENAMIQLEQESQNFKTRINLLQKSQKDNMEQISELRKENEKQKKDIHFYLNELIPDLIKTAIEQGKAEKT